MGLADYNFRSSYNKIDHNIANEFYLPCMRNAIRYDRITGYFGSTVYLIAWDALKEFVDHGGKMRIICSPFISDEDAKALSEGNRAKTDDILRQSLQDEIQNMLTSSYLEKPSRLLACLISNGTISIKLAVPGEQSHPAIRQLFHDKVGIFCDAENAQVGFRGSLNETFSGLSNCGNIESIDVFQSWDGGKDAERAFEASRFFNRVWVGQTSTTLLCELPQCIKERLHQISKDALWLDLLDEVREDIERSSKWIPVSQTGNIHPLRGHQIAALESWELNNRRGIFEHATGSGKTFTAICAIRNALIRKKVIIILVPSIGLLEQWESELRRTLTDIKVDYLICGGSNFFWKRQGVLNSWTMAGTDRHAVVLVTMDTAYRPVFLNNITQGEHLLVVADEVHRIGSRKRAQFLSVYAGERLGLSATPRRYGDPEGTAAIMEYFGGVLKPVYTLRDAIHDGVLSKYFYYPVATHLSPREQDDWNRISGRISRLYAQLMAAGADESSCLSNNHLQRLMIQRSRIVKNATSKIDLAGEILREHYQKGQKWIVYCDNKIQLEKVLELLLSCGIDAYEYHSAMQGDRLETLRYFSSFGGVLVSIRCLDEGIDVPSTTHALILASSKNPREFIQRRGRILRRFDEKPFAYLFDVIVTPNGEEFDCTKKASIIESEISRAIQFGEWAENPSCIAKLKNIAVDYGIDIEASLGEGDEDNE